MLFQICAPASLLQHPAHRQTHTREHSSGMTSVFSLCTKQGTNCTVDCFTVKRSWIRHLLSLPSWYGFKVDLLKVCGCVCMSMPVTLCCFMRVLCYSCTLYTHCVFMYISLCVHKHSWTHQVMTHVDPISVIKTWPASSQLSLYARTGF